LSKFDKVYNSKRKIKKNFPLKSWETLRPVSEKQLSALDRITILQLPLVGQTTTSPLARAINRLSD